jgi:hypothetical protein
MCALEVGLVGSRRQLPGGRAVSIAEEIILRTFAFGFGGKAMA